MKIQDMRKDIMSGFFTRDEFFPFLKQVIHDAEQHKKIFSIALFDLDGFKKINDKHGHLFGDEVLKEIFGALHLALREQGYGFRYGGDEIIVIFPDKTSGDVYELVERCREVIADCMFKVQKKSVRLTISCGMSDYDRDGKTVDELIWRADNAVYVSKRYGGNLITRGGRIGYIKLRNTILYTTAVLVVFSSIFLLNHYIFKGVMQNAIKQIKAIRIVKDVDTIILKNGSIIRADILKETENKMLVSLDLKEAKAEFVLAKSEIEEVIYASKPFFK